VYIQNRILNKIANV